MALVYLLVLLRISPGCCYRSGPSSCHYSFAENPRAKSAGAKRQVEADGLSTPVVEDYQALRFCTAVASWSSQTSGAGLDG